MNNPPACEAVLFDFYGTLARATDWGVTFDDVLAGYGCTVSDGTRQSSDSWSLEDGLDHAEHSGNREAYVAWERARLERLADACGADPSQRAEVVDALHAAAKTFSLGVYDDVVPTLTALRSQGMRTAVCSNWDWDLPEVIDQLGLADAFDAVVTSARAGARKPHPRIYAHTLGLVDAAPERTLFVGDSFGPDVEGPLAVGMRAVHLCREGNENEAVVPAGAHRVGTLRAVEALV